jgi:uncharacterized protein YebE (UPF0316 family)
VCDSRILYRFKLYRRVQNQGLFDVSKSVDGIPPYLLSDKGYSLINWITTPFKKEGQDSILELLYNRKHKRGRYIVEMLLVF